MEAKQSPTSLDTVSTREAASILGITAQNIAMQKCRGTLGLIQVSRGNRRRGIDATWTRESVEQKLKEYLSAVVGTPAIEVKRQGVIYVELHEAARRVCGLDSRPKTGSPFAGTIRNWMKVCPLLPQKHPARPENVPSFEVRYRLSASNRQIFRFQYVHWTKLCEAVANRKAGGIAIDPDRVRTPEARQLVGLGYKEFKRQVEDGIQCFKLVGRACRPKTICCETMKPFATWLKSDMLDVKTALARECAKHPEWLIEKDARRLFHSLPSTPFRYFRSACKFLPGDRAIGFKKNVLRRHKDGRHEWSMVYDPADLKLIEDENKLMIRDSRDRIIGKKSPPTKVTPEASSTPATCSLADAANSTKRSKTSVSLWCKEFPSMVAVRIGGKVATIFVDELHRVAAIKQSRTASSTNDPSPEQIASRAKNLRGC